MYLGRIGTLLPLRSPTSHVSTLKTIETKETQVSVLTVSSYVALPGVVALAILHTYGHAGAWISPQITASDACVSVSTVRTLRILTIQLPPV